MEEFFEESKARMEKNTLPKQFIVSPLLKDLSFFRFIIFSSAEFSTLASFKGLMIRDCPPYSKTKEG